MLSLNYKLERNNIMKRLIGLIGLLVAFSASAIEVNFGDPVEVELKISTVTMNEQGMNVTYEGEAGKYGMVFASHTYVPSNLEETQGHFTGSVQAIDDQGNVDRSFTAGLWSRDGTTLRVYGYDDDNLNRIMWVGEGNLKTKAFEAKVWELDSQ